MSVAHPPIVGRHDEARELERAIDRARSGLGAALVLRGEAGIGKSTLLRHVLQLADDLPCRSVVGVEAESTFPFAGLHRLLVADLDLIADLPAGQGDALNTAFGLTAGEPVDARLVGPALLSLLGSLGGERGVVVVVDDVQWVDEESVRALSFAARRLQADGVAIVFAVRTGDESPRIAARFDPAVLDALPTIELEGLNRADSLDLLGRTAGGPVSALVGERIVAATLGNPLALLDLGQELSTTELSGASSLREPVPLGQQLESHYRRRVTALDPPTQTWLLLAAAEPTADVFVVNSAARSLGIDTSAADAAESAGVVTIRTNIRFRHPLVRSAVYGGATLTERRTAHRALGDVSASDDDLERRTWHSAMASSGTDDLVADELERCADRAGDRGGLHARATYLTRAAELAGGSAAAGRRLVAAAEAAFDAGSLVQAGALLDRAGTLDIGDLERGRMLMLRAQVGIVSGKPGAQPSGAATCLEAAELLGPTTAAGRRALLAASRHSILAAQLSVGADASSVAAAIDRSAHGDVDGTPLTDRFLAAFAALADDRTVEAVDLVRSAVDALAALDPFDPVASDFTVLATSFSTATWDWKRRDDLLERAAASARASGSLSDLDTVLYSQSMADTTLGDLVRAEQRLVEGQQVRSTLGTTADVTAIYRHPELLAWTGGDPGFIGSMDGVIAAATTLGMGAVATIARIGLTIHHLAHGRYVDACATAERAAADDPIGVNSWALADLVEASVRSDRTDLANQALLTLSVRANASGNSWALGVLARATALVDCSPSAEHAYRRSIALLAPTPARADIARSHLVYGEWLRRRKRRADARTQLRLAHDLFVGMGAEPFAERTRAELAATGERVRKRTADTALVLTPQEGQIARLAADGLTNAEIGSRLFISAKTVDYHLGKIYRKLSVESRRDLRHAAL